MNESFKYSQWHKTQCTHHFVFIIVLLFTKNKNCDLEMKKRFTPERVKPVEAELIWMKFLVERFWSRCILLLMRHECSTAASWLANHCANRMFFFLSFLHSHHLLPAPPLNPSATLLFYFLVCFFFLFLKWEWTFIGPRCSSGLVLSLAASAVMYNDAWPIAATPAVFHPAPVPRPVSVPQLQSHPLPRGPP